LTAAEVETILGNEAIAPFLNTRHALYKERGFATKLPSRPELIQLILAEPNLLRRPIARKGDQVVLGFDQQALKNLG
jgi:arsenate reductase-like glutaredoxin family protein